MSILASTALEGLRQRMSGAVLSVDPFPHMYVDDFLPPELYAQLAAAWPREKSFRAKRSRQKLDMVPSETYTDPYTEAFATLPPDVRAVWLEFVEINRTVVGPWLATVFAPHIRERVALLQRLAAEGRSDLNASGLATGRVRANAGRLMMRGRGYTLAPHIDSAYYLVTVLHYFAEGPDEGYGTRLFRASSPIPMDAFVNEGTTQYFETHGIDTVEAARLPFRANSVVAFPNLLDSAHGVMAPPSGYRKVFQYHLSLKGDEEPI